MKEYRFVVQIELDRAWDHAQVNHLLHLELGIGMDRVVSEDAAGLQGP